MAAGHVIPRAANAAKCYDGVSGWGTPNGKKLLAALPSV